MYVIFREPSYPEYTYVIEKIDYTGQQGWHTTCDAAWVRMVLVKSGRRGTDVIVHGFGNDSDNWSIYYIKYRGTDGFESGKYERTYPLH